jgi:flagella basal body P-ring formation protein FlgA
LAIIGFSAAATGGTAADRVSVRAPETVHVDPQSLQLKHIAVLTGGDADLRQAAGEISIGQAPDPGRTRSIDKADIVGYLHQGGVAIDRVRLAMPDQIAVHRNGVTISDAFMERIVTGYLMERLPWSQDRVSVSKFTVNGETLLPPGKITYRVLPPPKPDYLQTIPLSVVFYVDGIPRKKTWVTVKFSVMTPVVVTRHPIGRNQSISGGDIKMVDMDLASLPAGVITRPDEVIGLRARRTLHIDTPLREDLVERPPLVDRGDIVKIVLVSGGLVVSTLGEVKEKGRRGEKISVVNLESKRRVLAQVVDSKTVKVDF